MSIVLKLDWTSSWEVYLDIGMGAEIVLGVKLFLELHWEHNWELYCEAGSGELCLRIALGWEFCFRIATETGLNASF